MKVSIPLLVGALPLLAAGFPFEFWRRQNKESQTEFDQETASFVSQGLCRVYSTRETEDIYNKGLGSCTGKCGKLISDGGNATQVTCLSGGLGIPTYTDPDGYQFNVGKCLCGRIPLLDDIIDDVLMALPAIAEIGCEILFDALDKVLEIGAAAIPGVGEELDAGMAAGVQAAKTIAENGQDASSFLQWIANPCGSSNYTAMIDKIFDPLSNVPDSVMPGLGCKKKPCPGKKGGDGDDSSTPKSKDPATPTKTESTPKTSDPVSSNSPASTTDTPVSSNTPVSSETPASTKTSASSLSSNVPSSTHTPKSSSSSDTSVSSHTTVSSTTHAHSSSSRTHTSAPSTTKSHASTSTDSASASACSTHHALGKTAACGNGTAKATKLPAHLSSRISGVVASLTAIA